MSSVAMYVSSDQLLRMQQDAQQDVARAQQHVNFALSFVGHCVDHFGAFFVRRGNQRLVNILVRFKGLMALMPEFDPDQVIDGDGEVAAHVESLKRELDDLHRTLVKASNDMKLKQTHAAFRESIELSVALRRAAEDLNLVLREHNVKALMGGDARRLMSDLQRTDDVAPDDYAELATVLRALPQERRASR